MNDRAELEVDGPHAEARRVVQRYSMGAVVPALVPIPLVDAGLVFAVQLKLIHRLAGIYGVAFETERARSILTSLVGGGLSAMSGATVARAIPAVGWIAGIATTGAVGGASTWAVGQLFTQHFASGGTLLTFDPEKVRAHYVRLVEAGRPRGGGPAQGPRKP